MEISIYKTKITLLLIILSILIFPTITRAQINAQGIGALIIQCATATAANQEEGASSMSTVEQRRVATTENNAKKLAKKEACSDAIAKYTMGQLLSKLTQETLNWINGGFKGNPSYLQNPEAYLKSIANQERTQLLSLLGNDPVNFPYGRAAMQAMVNRELNKGFSGFAQRAKYTLNSYVPTGNAADFHRDFRIGGWDAFFAQSFQQQNNPVGFALLASEEEARRTAGDDLNKLQLAQKELDQNSGFLNNKLCSESYHPSGEYEPPETTNDGIFTEADWIAIANDPNRTEAERIDAKRHICKTWVTKTPGTLIAHALNKTVIDVPLDQTIFADEINESLNTVFAALLTQTFQNGTKTLQGGIASLQEEANSFSLGSIGLGDILFDPGSAIGQGLSGASTYFGGIGENTENIQTTQGSLTGWLNQGQEFDIYNQLPYIIYLQKKYIGDPSAVLPQGIDQDTGQPFIDPTPGFNGVLSQNQALRNSIIQSELLDVCIPGPNPTFEQKIFEKIQSGEEDIRETLATSTQVASFLSPSGSVVGKMTEASEQAIQLLYKVGKELTQKIKDKYRTDQLGNMPTVTNTAYKELVKIDKYQNIILENQEKVEEIQTLLRNLEYLQTRINSLRDQVESGVVSPEVASTEASVLVNTFYEVAPDAIKAEDLIELRSVAEVALGNIAYINTLTDACWEERNDPGYTGEINQVPYSSISGNTLYGIGSGNTAHFLSPGVTLDYGTDFGSILNQITFISTGGIAGSLSTFTILQTLDWFGSGDFDGFNVNSNWFEDWTNIQ